MRRLAYGIRSKLGDERGSVLVLVALSSAAILAFAALAIDMGMLMTARAEAQRAADSAALAGASAYLDSTAVTAVPVAKQRARTFGGRNMIRNTNIDTTMIRSTANVDTMAEEIVLVKPDSFLVRVWVRRPSIGLWFAKVFGVNTWGVSAVATAKATQAGATRCLKPFVVPDMWQENGTDANDNNIADGETWTFDPTVDHYKPFMGADSTIIGPDPTDTTSTGYGSHFRDGSGDSGEADYGRQVSFKYQNPGDKNFVLTPGVFMPWDLPDASGNSVPGGNWYRQNINTCNNQPVQLGKSYDIENGNMVGPTFQGVNDLIAEDQNAAWDNGTGRVVNSTYGDDWMASPRVIKIAMASPDQMNKPGKTTVKFNNFALFFIESMPSNKDPVTGRFLYYVEGEESGPTTGSLTFQLRLVK